MKQMMMKLHANMNLIFDMDDAHDYYDDAVIVVANSLVGAALALVVVVVAVFQPGPSLHPLHSRSLRRPSWRQGPLVLTWVPHTSGDACRTAYGEKHHSTKTNCGVENSHGLTWTTTQSTVPVPVDGENEGSHSVFGLRNAITSIFAIFRNGVCSQKMMQQTYKHRCSVFVSFGMWQGTHCISKNIEFSQIWPMNVYVLQVYADTCTNISLAVRQLSKRVYIGSRGSQEKRV